MIKSYKSEDRHTEAAFTQMGTKKKNYHNAVHKMACYHCGKKGHYTWDCKHKHQHEQMQLTMMEADSFDSK